MRPKEPKKFDKPRKFEERKPLSPEEIAAKKEQQERKEMAAERFRAAQRGENGVRELGRKLDKILGGKEHSTEKEGLRPRRNKIAKNIGPKGDKKAFRKAQMGGPIRLNRFVAQSGVCSRRDADTLIQQGLIVVNGVVTTEFGVKVDPQVDTVEYRGKKLAGEKKVYILMNKPRGYVTSVDDPHNDKTVLDLLQGKVAQRVYPVGRLDKETTGVLLITNDGELTKELTHPSYEHKKIYHVFLDKPCTTFHLEELARGVELEDGMIHADEISFVEGNKKEVGVELHSGRNRIVRRMFEHLGYRVNRLDRVFFAGFTKSGLRRGYWRYLNDLEVSKLLGKKY